MRSVVFKTTARPQWLKLPPQLQERIAAKIDALAKTGQGDVKKLKGQDGARLRVGDYRVIFYQKSDTIVVAAIGHRREIYDWGEAVKVEFRQTPAGEVAIIPRAEYERLKALSDEAAEDIGTAKLVARAKQDKGLRLPIAVVEQLASGENPIRVLRKFRGLTQAELATAESVQITQNYLSDLETGKRSGPFELHRKIAQFLDVPFELLAPIAVSAQEADPGRFAKRNQVVADINRQRGKR